MKPREFNQVLVAKLTILAGVALMLVLGSEILSDRLFGDRRMVPAPLSEVMPYDLYGKPQGIWGGDNFQLAEPDGKLHFVIIEGVDSPKPGQESYSESRRALIELINRKRIRVRVIRRDEQQREVGFVFVPRSVLKGPICDLVSGQEITEDRETGSMNSEEPAHLDVGYEMIWMGWGWYDRSSFALSSRYHEAEESAKQAKKGLWSQPSPIAPWDSDSGNSK